MAVGGDIIEVTFNHPTIGSGVFFPKANEDNSYDTGGVRTADDTDSVDGGGNPIWKMTRKLGFFEMVLANDMDVNKDLEKLAELHASPVPADWTFTVINGKSYGGKGKIVSDVTGNIGQATVPLKVNGAKFEQI